MVGVSQRVSGAMAALMGLAPERIDEICAEASALGVVEVANYNEAGQTVVSGQDGAVAEAMRLALEAGAERAVPLKVSAPFHCSLMRVIEDEFAAELARVTFRSPRLPVYSSVTGTLVRDGAHARDLLRRQLVGPVRWVDVLMRRRADRPGRLSGGRTRPGAQRLRQADRARRRRAQHQRRAPHHHPPARPEPGDHHGGRRLGTRPAPGGPAPGSRPVRNNPPKGSQRCPKL